MNDVPYPIVFTTSRFGSLGRLHQLCQLEGLGYSFPAFSMFNLGYDEPRRRKFAIFSECPGMNDGRIALILRAPNAQLTKWSGSPVRMGRSRSPDAFVEDSGEQESLAQSSGYPIRICKRHD